MCSVFTFVKYIFCLAIKPLPNDKTLDWSKMKAFADDKINVTEKLKFVLGKIQLFSKQQNFGCDQIEKTRRQKI